MNEEIPQFPDSGEMAQPQPELSETVSEGPEGTVDKPDNLQELSPEELTETTKEGQTDQEQRAEAESPPEELAEINKLRQQLGIETDDTDEPTEAIESTELTSEGFSEMLGKIDAQLQENFDNIAANQREEILALIESQIAQNEAMAELIQFMANGSPEAVKKQIESKEKGGLFALFIAFLRFIIKKAQEISGVSQD